MIIKITNLEYRSLQNIGKYKIEYKVGEVIKTLPGTVGIFCIKNQDIFCSHVASFYDLTKCKFLEVEGIGVPNYYKKMSGIISQEAIDEFYSGKRFGMFPTNETILYEAIKVIREIPYEEINKIIYEYNSAKFFRDFGGEFKL